MASTVHVKLHQQNVNCSEKNYVSNAYVFQNYTVIVSVSQHLSVLRTLHRKHCLCFYFLFTCITVTLPIFLGQAIWSKHCLPFTQDWKWPKSQNISSVFIGQNEVRNNQKVAVPSSHVEYTLIRGQIPIILNKILNSFSVLHSNFIKIEMVWN